MDEPDPHLSETHVAHSAPVIDAGEVQRIAALAHLALSEEDIARYTRDLGAILAYVKLLEEVDVSEVAATAHAGFAGDPDMPVQLRADVEGASLRRDVVLREAPKVAMAGFAVPSFADDEA